MLESQTIANFYFRAEVDLCWTLQGTQYAKCFIHIAYRERRRRQLPRSVIQHKTSIWDVHASRRGISYRVCIVKAAVNETVCEDSHAEHVQFETAADSTPFRT